MCLLVVLIGGLLAPPVAAAPGGPAFVGDAAAIAEIKAAYDAFARVTSYRGRMTGAATGTLEWSRPDRMRVRMTEGGQTVELVTIGGKTWMKMAGQCRPMPGGQPAPVRAATEWGPDVASVKVTKGGTHTIEGARTQAYALAVTFKDGKTTWQTVHVDLRTRLIRRIEMPGESGGRMTIDYLEYNIPLAISPPC
jgi:outer membrane lipoprotein-sorting protein